ncbi:hypothetical protein M9H77_27378 [Catharanthus roseus]|uniref:Uncharacterized protein n=1 Tax=Catharanthus roseus TaxID=4058 RepID=A0ACC0ACI3_CATRO|nr:hypothetical protein M9H77_27378 [Catharanthus roseus]
MIYILLALNSIITALSICIKPGYKSWGTYQARPEANLNFKPLLTLHKAVVPSQSMEATLGGRSNEAASSSSYSLREIIPERDPIPVVDLSEGESVERPAAQGIEFGMLIEKDPSESESDSEIVAEPEGAAPAYTEVWAPFVAGGSPLAISPIPVLPAESASSFPSLPLLGEVGEQEICEYCMCRE